jgi:ATP-dependent DNA helicase DinG
MLNQFVACDLETTGLDPYTDKIVEIGMVKAENGEIKDKFHALINPGRTLPVRIKRLTGLNDADLAACPPLIEVLPDALKFIGDTPLVGHNIGFDLRFLSAASGRALSNETYDTLELARLVLPGASGYRLDALCGLLGIEIPRHRALQDAEAAAALFLLLSERLRSQDLGVLVELNRLLAQARSSLSPFLNSLVREGMSRFSDQKIKPHNLAVFAENDEAEPRRASGGGAVPATPLDLVRVQEFFSKAGPLSGTISGYELRPQQAAMAAKITQSLNAQKYLLLEAGTGVGKSMAYLLPLILWCAATGQRAVVSTHTINLQEQLWGKDVPLLARSAGVPFKAALVKGRSNYLCLRRWFAATGGEHFPEEAAFLARVFSWLSATKTGEKSELSLTPTDFDYWHTICGDSDSCLGGVCRYQKHCFINRARRKAEEADLIIVNHSLLFTDVRSENRVLPSYGPLVIDEAHHLEDAATSHLGRQVAQGALNTFFAALGKILARLKEKAPPSDGKKWYAAINEVQEMRLEAAEASRHYFFLLGEFVRNYQSGNDRDYGRVTLRLPRNGEDWQDVVDRSALLSGEIKNLAGEAEKVAEMMELWAISDEGWVGRTRDLTQTIQSGLALAGDLEFIMNGSGDNFVYWVETDINAEGSAGHTTLLAAPIDVGSLLYENFFKNKVPVILTSATLSVGDSFQHYKERTGLHCLPDGQLLETRLESPFAYEKQALLCINRELPAPGMAAPADYLDRLAQVIHRLISANKGRSLILFTSHRTLREVYRRLKPGLEEEDICILGHGIDGGRSRILEEFKTTVRSVLLGSSSFWEGVDVPGEALTCVVIVKLPFWSPSVPVIEARLDDLAGKNRDGFREFSVPQAIIRFKQGFGRLIRTGTDRGAVVILDRRILEKRYGRFFLSSLPLKSHIRGDTDMIAKKISEWMENRGEMGPVWTDPEFPCKM